MCQGRGRALAVKNRHVRRTLVFGVVHYVSLMPCKVDNPDYLHPLPARGGHDRLKAETKLLFEMG